MSKPFPTPPGAHLTNRGTPSTGADAAYKPPGVPAAPEIVTVNGRLSEDETSIILRQTLLPQHREDPNILRFISNYLVCRDTKQAAREAGIPPRSGDMLRRRPDIHNCITKLTEKSVMKYGYDASEVIEKVKEIAALDPIEFENEDGTFKTSMRDIAPESRRAIKKFKAKNIYSTDPNGMRIITGMLIEVELYDKLKASELLGREKDIFKETRKVEHDVTSRMADVLLGSKQRADDLMARLDAASTIDVTPESSDE